MHTHSDDLTPLIPPSAIDISLAEKASRLVARYAKPTGSAVKIQFRENGKSVEIALPPLVVRLLLDILKDIAKGNPVAVIPVEMELTTQQAAEFLNVSRPFFVGLLEKGELKYKKIGTHRRVCVSDLLAYKKKIEVEQDESIKELAKQAQELDMGY
ncbi:MAG: helix-turn-helix domain-containing protein [Alphaproteobacteria bacterium]|nr:helix-turn-helix domain-containing protein [Alphaproteobacteria bacterium]